MSGDPGSGVIWELHKTTAHDPKYAKLFTGWRDATAGRWQTVTGKDGERLDIFIVEEVAP